VLRRKHSVLVDVGDPLPPDPLSGALLILPGVIQESSRIGSVRAVSPATEQPEITVGVGKPGSSPSRPGDIRRDACTQIARGLGRVRAGLIGEVASRDPNPLLGRNIKLPKIVQNRTGRGRTGVASSGGIESESAEEPNVSGRIGPEHGGLAPTRRVGPTS